MTAANKELQRQKGEASDEDLERAAERVELDSFMLDVASQKGLTVNIAESITEGKIKRTMEGASTLSVTINDGTLEILRSGIFGTKDNKKLPTIDVKVDGLWFRLTEFDKEGYSLKLVFEDRIVAYLRTHIKHMVAKRGSCTRAQFIQRQVKQVKATHIRYVSPELHVKQPVEHQKPKKISARERKAEQLGGLLATTDLTVKHVAADKNQLEVFEQALDQGSKMGANTKVLVSAIMCIIQESDAKNDLNNPATGIGVFSQVDNGAWPAKREVPADAAGYFKQAMRIDSEKPNLKIEDLVQEVQHSGAGATKYGPWEEESIKIVEEYGKHGISSSAERVVNKEYEYHRGPPDGPAGEDAWECTGRLAREVNWRRFVVGQSFYFVQDKDLMKKKPTMEVSEESEGIEKIDGNIAAGQPVAEASIKCRASRWFAPPGSVVKIKNHGPFTGRWLVFRIERDIFSPETDIALHMPEAAKPEKAPEQETIPQSGGVESGLVAGGTISGKTPRERIVNAAKWALEHKADFKYAQVRPMAKSLFSPDAFTKTDCSAFSTLCYKAAGVKDPNGLGYGGGGNTVTLKSNGRSTHSPEPGDLIFYEHPEHVAVYIGDGKVIELGGTPGPNEEAINYRTVSQMRTYSLETSSTPSPAPSAHGGAPVQQAELGPVGEPGGSRTHLGGLEEVGIG